MSFFATLPIPDTNYTVDENNIRHYILTQETTNLVDISMFYHPRQDMYFDWFGEEMYILFFVSGMMLLLLFVVWQTIAVVATSNAHTSKISESKRRIILCVLKAYPSTFVKNQLTEIQCVKLKNAYSVMRCVFKNQKIPNRKKIYQTFVLSFFVILLLVSPYGHLNLEISAYTPTKLDTMW